ncbi:MAG: outer membrane protein assembly factor BamE, partial [Porticoccaceae bacterium]|nr:outer membrane protein assembly factor BamE [Porticoccaceae bacterium]
MRFFILTLIFITLLSSGCSWIKFPGVHKINVQQGNILDQEMVDKLQPGMSKTQVQFVLGTPIVTDSFNTGRWDYVF